MNDQAKIYLCAAPESSWLKYNKKGAAQTSRAFDRNNENYFITSPSFLKKSIRRLQSASALAKSSSALAGLVLVKLA